MSADTEWRWADPAGQQRLVRTDELRAALASGVLAPNTPVWRQGWTEWRPATEVPELTTSALSAANGVVPNIPPPPMNVVAAQHAFEGEPVAVEDKSKGEPPPPPKYVPAPTRARPGVLHTPSQPMRAPASLASAGSPAPQYSVSANTAVNIRALNEGDAHALVSKTPHGADGAPPPRLPEGQGQGHDPHERKTVPNPLTAADERKTVPNPIIAIHAASSTTLKSAPPPPPRNPGPGAGGGSMGIASLVRSSSSPPPPLRSMSSKPPPPPRSAKSPLSKPPAKPPRAEDAGKDVIEELSGSVLLADGSGAQNAIEELSGSILLPDQSGSIQTGGPREKSGALLMPDLSGPAPVMSDRRSEELSANFLLDAGSTGALPSVESTGRILAAKAASRAPFGAPYEPPSSRLTPPPIVPLALPLGSTPPPPPAHMLPAGVDGSPPGSPHAAQGAQPPQGATGPGGKLGKHVPTLLGFQPQAVPPSQPFLVEPGLVEPGLVEPGLVEPGPVAPEVPALATLVGVPPPPDHVLADVARSASAPLHGEGETANGGHLPPPERSTARLHDFRALGHDPRARSMIIAFSAIGVVVFIGIVGLVIAAFHKKPGDEPMPVASASASSAGATISASSAPAPTVAAAAVPPTAPPGALGAACTLAGAAHVIAPRAVVQSGVEASVVGSKLALGFASREHDGFAVAIDPSSAAGAQTVRAHAPGPIRRLVPIEGEHGLAAAADSDREADFLGGRRTIPSTHPFDLGFGGGGLAWAPYHSNEVALLWTLDGDEPVEAVRAAPLDAAREEAGWAIAFRRGTTIYAGAVTGGATFTAKGPLVKVAGLGSQVGSPTVAAQDGAVLVAWADRAQPSEPWSLRWMRFAPGEATAEAKPFVPSEGGLGEHAMSPTLAAAGQGRFVIAWTEGPVATHQVRAQTMSGSGTPLGTAMAISDSGVNAGQAQLAILPDGHGVVAYLASSGAGPKASYEVLATPIVCP